jgi:hypothetical protein
MRRVRYTAAPRIFRSAITARARALAIDSPVTAVLNTSVRPAEARYRGSVSTCR